MADQIVKTNQSVNYVKDGAIYQDGNGLANSVLINGQADLALLTDYSPGTIAYTAGFASMWQLSASGTWVEV